MWKKILIMGALILSLFAVTVSSAELCRCGCEETVEACHCGYNEANLAN